jgi:AraC-like DNA-binding protein
MSQRRHAPADEPHFLMRSPAAVYPDGGSVAPHTHPWGQLIYAVSGVLSVWTGRGAWVAPPHWAVWAPAGVRHSLRFTGVTALRTLYLRPGLAASVEDSAAIGVSPLLRELIVRAVELGFLDERQPAHAAMAALIVGELHCHPAAALDLPLPQSARLRKLAEYLWQAPEQRGNHATLAKRFGLGTRTMERDFAAETGLSLGRWRSQSRFLHALRRLGSGASVKQAALEAGYQRPSAFIAAFRFAFNTTPGRYFQTGRD